MKLFPKFHSSPFDYTYLLLILFIIFITLIFSFDGSLQVYDIRHLSKLVSKFLFLFLFSGYFC